MSASSLDSSVVRAIEMIRPYYIRNPSGGNLHIALDDGNLEDGNIWWCIDHAAKQRDLESVQIAAYLLSMTEDARWQLYDLYDEYAR